MKTALIIIAAMVSGTDGGGVSMQISRMDFATEQACESAASFVKRNGHVYQFPMGKDGQFMVTQGRHKIEAECVAP